MKVLILTVEEAKIVRSAINGIHDYSDLHDIVHGENILENAPIFKGKLDALETKINDFLKEED